MTAETAFAPGGAVDVVLTVADTGVGMNAAQIARLFSPSRRPTPRRRGATAAPGSGFPSCGGWRA